MPSILEFVSNLSGTEIGKQNICKQERSRFSINIAKESEKLCYVCWGEAKFVTVEGCFYQLHLCKQMSKKHEIAPVKS